ncbi:uridine kinase [Sporosarcina sp. P16b]|uniref:kinase n=1 Tax=Sporosarcina sp. P16b TaxID=2048261 RepID=UPI000C166147|nr:kinase [Sporosarcina sp. P16b]PIC70108.1 uridine kinase [Sporosarcina sp. P16b]
MFAGETAETLYNQFLNRPNKNRPLIVGLDGLGGAGKTTFVKMVKQKLKGYNCKVNIVHLDDHIVEKNKRYHTGYEEWYEFYYLQWDIDGLLNTFLKSLYNSEHLHLSFYDKSTDSISNRQVDVLAGSIVLIEGIFLQRKEWKIFFDYVIFLNCPFELRKERVLNRDSYIGEYQDRLKKYTERYWLGEKHYLDTINPYSIADLVINI